jgi:enolase
VSEERTNQHKSLDSSDGRARILAIRAREVLDSKGNPTVEVDVELESGVVGRASVPAGSSTGRYEARELRDGDPSRYSGKGVRGAIRSVSRIIAPLLSRKNVLEQEAIDGALNELDGTQQKGELGSNAILAVSLAVARAAAQARGLPLYRALAEAPAALLPVPLLNVMNGGLHADNNVDFEEFMIAPVGAPTFADAMRMGAETYAAIRSELRARGLGTALGDEGGFAPNLRANVEAIEIILRAIEQAGLRPKDDVVLALDAATSGFFVDGSYRLRRSHGRSYSSGELIELYEDWTRQFPIASIEDGLAEDDWDGWRLLTRRLGHRLQLVGDDVFATNAEIIRRGIASRVANAVVIKLNQIGTLSEARDAVKAAQAGGYTVVVSHRSGETTDEFIADFAVAVEAPQIKAGAPCRERVAKYNQLVRIEEALGAEARYAGRRAFPAWRDADAADAPSGTSRELSAKEGA